MFAKNQDNLSPVERGFAADATAAQAASWSLRNLRGSIVLHAIAAPAALVVGEHAGFLAVLHAGELLLALALLALIRRGKVGAPGAFTACAVILSVGYMSLLRGGDAPIVVGVLECVLGLGLGVCVVASLPHQALLVGASVAAALAFGHFAKGFGAWLLLYTFSVVGGGLLASGVRAVQVAGRLAIFRRLARMAPAGVVRQSILANRPLEAIFPAAQRRCFCASIGWVGYEAMVDAGDLAAVTRALDAYYDAVNAAIGGGLAGTAHFLDVTADEIFLVGYAEREDAPLAALWATAAAFAERLAAACPIVEATAPDAVVCGLSVGSAWVGLVGPKASQKTTALGEVAGRAARLRTLAKALAPAPCRAVLDASAAPAAFSGDGWRPLVVTPAHGIKDFPHGTVVTLEKAA